MSVADTAPLNGSETVTVTLSQPPQSLISTNGLGTLSDPTGGGTFKFNVFTETGLIGGTPNFATDLLSRLVYTPPALDNGNSYDVNAVVNITNTAGDNVTSRAVTVDLVTAPSITHTTPDQPVTGGATVRPFATTQIVDRDYDQTATDTAMISVTENSQPTDLDGALSGPGLTKTAPGIYMISGYAPFNLQNLLNNLQFQTNVLGTGETKHPVFNLVVTDERSGLMKTDGNTSLAISGPPTQPVKPTITGTVANQKVESGNVIQPFHGVTIGDANAGAVDTLTITVTDTAGGANDSVGTFLSQPYLKHEVGSGIYTISGVSPALLTTEVDSLVFAPAPFNTADRIGNLLTDHASFKLTVTNTDGIGLNQTATDTTASTTTGPATQPTDPTTPGNGSNNFLVHNQTTGETYQSAGKPYSGPVAGITNEIVFATTDNINVNAETANVFIHSGSGQDGLTVLSGNNILDGSTNSNFLTGGTGHDTFYLDDRNPSSPIFSTIVNFHSGDDVTVFGVTKDDFTQIILEGQGAQGYTGVDLIFSAPGHVDTSFVLAGFTGADLTNGKLTQSYGHTPDTPGAPGADYMTLHAV